MNKKVKRGLAALTSWCDRLQQEAHWDRLAIAELRFETEEKIRSLGVQVVSQKERNVEIERALSHLIAEVMERQGPRITELERQVVGLNQTANELNSDYVEA